uniref:Mon2 C-terminal domain-containing protein n=1 Tax=Chlamydomonas leiostraca TaxID=1034604 RepID=A0A7S0NBW2_9CHLO
MTRGWEPLLAVLQPVPTQHDVRLVQAGFQCIELVCFDFLPFLPKEYMPRALEVVAAFTKQDVILNVCLTAITMLWSVTDTLARSKRTAPGASPGAAAVSIASRRDVSEEESVAMLMIAFKALRAVSTDRRPEVRNSAVRTLFLAMGAHGGKFSAQVLRECVWDMMLPLVASMHHMSETSSNEEVAASVLGTDKSGKSVKMLMHHSRNTEQKQWDETLVLALSGATKVLRAHLPAVVALEGFAEAWESLMGEVGAVLRASRRGTANAAIVLLSTLIQAHGENQAVMAKWMWKSALRALDQGVRTMSQPLTHAPLQARTELLSGLTAIHAVLRDQLGADDLRLLLGWLDRLARYPMGQEDSVSMHAPVGGGLGPIQKPVLALLQQLAPPPPAATEVWADMLLTLCNMLHPFRLLPYRPVPGAPSGPTTGAVGLSPARSVAVGALQHENNLAGSPMLPTSATMPRSLGAALGSSPLPSTNLGSRLGVPEVIASGGPSPLPSNSSSSQALSTGIAAPATAAGVQQPMLPQGGGEEQGEGAGSQEDVSVEAKCLTSNWMCRVADTVAGWYKDSVPWQVRVATFPALVSSLSECMAMRHVDPNDELWRTASKAFNAIVQSGLPSINIASHGLTVQAAAAAAQQTQGYSLSSLSGSLTSGISSITGYGSSPIPAASGSGAAAGADKAAVHQDTWPLLVRAFEMSLLGRDLPGPLPPGCNPNPPLLPPRTGAGVAPAAAAPGSTSSLGAGNNGGPGTPGPSARQTLASADSDAPPKPAVQSDVEIQAMVLDCLADSVLTSCQYASHDIRVRLVSIVDAGAAAAMAGEEQLRGLERFSHACLSKLFVLCSRGQDMPGSRSLRGSSSQSHSSHSGSLDGNSYPREQSARCQLEVAQLALPAFLSRCEAVIRAYVFEQRAVHSAAQQQGAGTPAPDAEASPAPAATPSTPAPVSVFESLAAGLGLPPGLVVTPQVDAQLADRALHALELCAQLRVSPSVMDAALPSRPELKPWVELVRARKRSLRQGSAGGAQPGAQNTSSGGAALPSSLAESREQTHLLPLYGALCECVACDDARVRDVVRQLLLAAGRELGLAPAGDPLAFVHVAGAEAAAHAAGHEAFLANL